MGEIKKEFRQSPHEHTLNRLL